MYSPAAFGAVKEPTNSTCGAFPNLQEHAAGVTLSLRGLSPARLRRLTGRSFYQLSRLEFARRTLSDRPGTLAESLRIAQGCSLGKSYGLKPRELKPSFSPHFRNRSSWAS